MTKCKNKTCITLESQVQALQEKIDALTLSTQFEKTHQELTGLPNRDLLFKKLHSALKDFEQTQKSFAVLLIDIAHFKSINDTLGHHMGDSVLKIVANRLENNIRKNDTVAHIGGDEFALLLLNAKSHKVAFTIAERLLEVLSEPFLLEKTPYYLMVNMGIALYPTDGMDTESLIKNADIALDAAKKQGKNNIVFYEKRFQQDSYKKLVLANELSYALDKGLLNLHYQPIIDTQNNEVVTLEALCRWNHPEKGNIPPLDFIPVAEETQLIVPLGNWALDTALKYLSSLFSIGCNHLRMAVNLSPFQLREEHVVENFLKLLKKYKIPSKNLELELTESALMENFERSITLLTALNKAGIKIAIDDFGTGFSSFSYLKKLPVSKLKIDRSFIQDIATNTVDQHIVQTIVSLANNLNIEVMAEGIETKEQADMLSHLGCHVMQGYFFSHPLPEEKVAEFLKSFQH